MNIVSGKMASTTSGVSITMTQQKREIKFCPKCSQASGTQHRWWCPLFATEGTVK